MGIGSEMKKKIKSKAERALIEEVIKRLESAIELRDQGKETESNAVVNDMQDWLDEIIKGIESDIGQGEPIIIERSSLPQAGEVVAAGVGIVQLYGISGIFVGHRDKGIVIAAVNFDGVQLL